MSDLRFACIRLPSFALRHFVHRQEEIHAGLYVCRDKRRIVSRRMCLWRRRASAAHRVGDPSTISNIALLNLTKQLGLSD